jgi:DNA-binding XRE family transcriptional regulator
MGLRIRSSLPHPLGASIRGIHYVSLADYWDPLRKLMDDLRFLRKRRQELGLSQNDLALHLKHRGAHLSRKAISAWERGEQQPDLGEA